LTNADRPKKQAKSDVFFLWIKFLTAIMVKCRLLTAMRTRAHIVVLCSIIMFFMLASTAEAASHLGFLLPDRAVAVEGNRFYTPQAWATVMKFYKEAYQSVSSVRRFTAVSIPGVKTIHFVNSNPDSRWESANVSSIKGKIYIFVIERRNKPGQK